MENNNNEFSLSSSQMDELKINIVDTLNKLLPSVIENVLSIVLEKTKEITDEFLSNHRTTNTPVDKKEKKYLVKKNRESWNVLLDKREEVFYKQHRTERILNLYDECLEKEDLYIPRKFRQDNTFIHSPEELDIIKNLELQKFETECKILRIRNENFSTDLDKIDEEIQETINKSTSDTNVQLSLSEDFKIFVKKDTDRIISKWNTKIESTRKAFLKDQEERQRKRSQRNLRNTQEVPTPHHDEQNVEAEITTIPETQLLANTTTVPETQQEPDFTIIPETQQRPNNYNSESELRTNSKNIYRPRQTRRKK